MIDDTISISKYNPLAEGSYFKSPKELYHPIKGLINIQNTDENECRKWCFARYLNSADHNPRTIKKANKDFANFTLKTYNFQSKLEAFTNSKKKTSIGISVFRYQNKENYPIYVSKNIAKKIVLTYY